MGGTLPPGTVKLIGTNGGVISYPKPTDDYDDPLNWSTPRKLLHYAIILAYVAASFASLDATIAHQLQIQDDLELNENDVAIATALRFLALGTAGIGFVPLAYRYGRRPVYLTSVLMQLACAIWSANMRSRLEYIVISCLAGAGASVSEALVPMTITDLFFIHQFATAYGWYIFAQGAGAFLGPVIASFIVEDQSWQRMFWCIAAAFGVIAALILVVAEESTFVPNIDNQIEAKTREETFFNRRVSSGGAETTPEPLDLVNLNRGVYLDLPPGPKSLRERFAFITRTGRPIRQRFLSWLVILVNFPGVAYAALTYGFVMAWLELLGYTIMTRMTEEPYNLGLKGLGLFNIAPFLGHLLGTLSVPPLSDRWVVLRAKSNEGMYEPEMRLWFAVPAGAFASAGILIFGLGISQDAPVPVLGYAFVLFSLGFGICLETALTYITDCYHNMIGDALVGVVFVRNALAAVLWLCVMPWLDSFGILNVFVTASSISVAILLLPVPLLYWGRRGRMATGEKYRYYSLAATPPSILQKIIGGGE